MSKQKKAIVFLSGGVDSKTCLAIARAQGYVCYALTFDYSQRNRIEIDYAKKIAAAMDVVEHRVFKLDLAQWRGSALTDLELSVPHTRSDEVPITYVPARNTVFLSLALSWAETIGVYDIFFGANADDEVNYPDCRRDYIRAFENLANLATREGVQGRRLKIHTPLLELKKADIIRTGLELGVDYADTFSCYDPTPEGGACEQCDACFFRKQGFAAVTS